MAIIELAFPQFRADIPGIADAARPKMIELFRGPLRSAGAVHGFLGSIVRQDGQDVTSFRPMLLIGMSLLRAII